MKFYPPMVTKALSECQPGELVRQPFKSAAIGIVARSEGEDDLTIVRLQDGRGMPRFLMPPEQHKPVLSYGLDYSIEIDQSVPIEFGEQELTTTPGVLWVNGADTMMFVSGPGDQWDPALFSLKDGLLMDRGRRYDSARFTKWKLSLAGQPSQPSITLFNFDLQTVAQG